MYGDQPGHFGKQGERTTPQQPLVLPGQSNQTQAGFSPEQPTAFHATPSGAAPYVPPIGPRPSRPLGSRPLRPEDLVRHPSSSMPANPIDKLVHLWRNDPAYRVLFIAITIVLVASIILVLAMSNLFRPPSSTSSPQTQGPGANTGVPASQTETATASKPTATPTTQPTPTPTATQQPTPTPEPTLEPTPTPMPEPTPTTPPVMGPLTVQITSIPESAENNSTVQVTVTTNKPGAQVSLAINYEVPPFLESTEEVTTDSNGQATINWNIDVNQFRRDSAKATVRAVAQDSEGMQAMSETKSVTISTKD